MRKLLLSSMFAVMVTMTAGSVIAGPVPIESCDVCTCESGEVVCVSVIEAEVAEEQVVCGVACAGIGSTHGTRERVDSPCSEVAACNNVGAPAASGGWLIAGALGLLAFGIVGLRRLRSTRAVA